MTKGSIKQIEIHRKRKEFVRSTGIKRAIEEQEE